MSIDNIESQVVPAANSASPTLQMRSATEVATIFFLIGTWIAIPAFWNRIDTRLEVVESAQSKLDRIEERLKVVESAQSKLDTIEETLIERADAYPVGDGTIADFGGSAGLPITTSLNNEQFSMLSDSANHGSSKVSYSWRAVNPVKGDGDGMLVLSYAFSNARPDFPPYVGIHVDFSTPPKLYDVSRFSEVVIRCRWGKPRSPGTKAYLQLCDRHIGGERKYAWAEYELTVNAVGDGNFESIRVPLGGLKRPAWSNPSSLSSFDPKHVYRLIIKIQGNLKSEEMGTFEIDDIRFAP